MEIASCTVPTTDSPDSSTVMLAAMTSDGLVPGGSAPAANSASVDTVATTAPTTCRKNGGSPHRPSRRPSRSMSAVTTNAASAVIGGAAEQQRDRPRPARPSPAVATQRGYGCGAPTASASSGRRRVHAQPLPLHPLDDAGDAAPAG